MLLTYLRWQQWGVMVECAWPEQYLNNLPKSFVYCSQNWKFRSKFGNNLFYWHSLVNKGGKEGKVYSALMRPVSGIDLNMQLNQYFLAASLWSHCHFASNFPFGLQCHRNAPTYTNSIWCQKVVSPDQIVHVLWEGGRESEHCWQFRRQ